MKRAIKKHWFELSISLAVLALCILGISILFGYMHRTNDDVLLRSIASGNYTGTPDAHLIYILYPLGLVFKGLYSLWGGVSWYDLFVVSLHYFCWWAIVIRIAALFESKWVKLFSIGLTFALLLILDLPYVVLNQYTALAGVCAATAVLWLILFDGREKEGRFLHVALISALMIVTLWLRKEVFFMAMPIGGCILLYQWLSHGKEEGFRSTWLKWQGILLGIIAVVGLLSMLVDFVAYTSPQWQDFKAYNQARTDIFDYYNLAPYNLNEAAYEAEGIDTTDYEVINSMSLILMPELDTAKMERLAELAKWHKAQMEQYYSVYRKTMYSVCNVLFYNEVQPLGTALTVTVVALLVMLVLYRRKAATVAALLALLYEAVFVGYFIWKNRFPERVSFGLFAMLLLFFAGMFLREYQEEKAERIWERYPVGGRPKEELFWRVLPIGVLVFALGNLGLYQYRNISDQVKEYRQAIGQWQQVQYYASQHPDKIYLVKANMAGLKGDVMYLETVKEPDNTLLLGTWISKSPHYHLRSENLGLGIIGEEFPGSDRICLLQLETDNELWLTEYYEARGYEGKAVVCDLIETTEGNIKVVQMK